LLVAVIGRILAEDHLGVLQPGPAALLHQPGAGDGGEAGPPVAGVPKVEARGQGGLLDVVVGPSFVADGRIYLS
jgi:glucose/arabinose dehydrogenase